MNSHDLAADIGLPGVSGYTKVIIGNNSEETMEMLERIGIHGGNSLLLSLVGGRTKNDLASRATKTSPRHRRKVGLHNLRVSLNKPKTCRIW